MKQRKLSDLKFITTNKKKAQDARQWGFGVVEGIELPDEIDHPDVSQVVIYKAYECQEEGIIVEDTALEVEGFNIGTNIKHAFEIMQNNASWFEGKKIIWSVALAAKREGMIWKSQAQWEGFWTQQNRQHHAYHFEQFLTQNLQGGDANFYCNWKLDRQWQEGPRYKALSQLKNAWLEGVMEGVETIDVSSIKPWDGAYQSEVPWTLEQLKASQKIEPIKRKTRNG